MMVERCKRAFAFGAALAATLVGAAPVDYFPINSQLPPVARISRDFEFIFSPLTFSSPTNMTYRLQNGPKWLSIDSSSRRLFGTPGDKDIPPGEVVGVPIDLVAQDKTGSTTTMATLVVSRNPPPQIAVPIAEQLPKFGTYIAPSSLHLHPARPFSFSFAKDTFKTASGKGGLNFYALTGDNTPLPSWISFNNEKLEFSGKTPPFESLIQPPETFSFQLVASDVVGFASVSTTFSLVVGSHELTADPTVVKLNATHGNHLVYDDLPNVLKLDKKPVKPEDVATISASNLPPWLSFDNKTWKLEGTPEPTAESSNITIAVTDKFLDTFNLTVSIRFGLFVSDLPDLNLIPGADFSFDLKKYLSNVSDVMVTLNDDPDAPWAEFNSSSLILSGTVPKPRSKSASASQISFKAASKQTNDIETKSMNIRVASTSPSPSPTPSPTPSTEPTKANDEGPNKNLLWLLVIPILLTFIGIIALLFYIRRQRQQHNRVSIKKVSGPMPGSFVFNRPDGPGKGSGYAERRMLDVGRRRLSNSSISAQNSGASAAVSNQQSSQATSSLVGNPAPHAMMATYSLAKSPAHSDILETRSSWSAGHCNQLSPRGIGATDEVSLLSDTSLGSGDAYIAEARAYSIIRTPRGEAFRGLEVPLSSEPFSIQNTPEIAYTTGGKYDSGSDSAIPPAVGYTVRPTPPLPLPQQSDPGLGIRSVGQRLSNLWKRQSGNPVPEERKRQSILSDATGQTTRTSILTSGISGVGEEEATTSTLARPTIIHIPSRPGEVRQMSRNSRLHESSPRFSVRSATKSPSNFGLMSRSPEPIDESPELPPTLEDPTNPRASDSSWDRLARNSLGIAYKDLIITEPRKVAPGREPLAEVIYEDNWIKHEIDRDLLSPDQWLQPANTSVAANMVGIATTSPANTSSELPRLPPTSALATPKGGKPGFERRPSRNAGATATLYHTPSLSSRSDASSSVRTQIAVGGETRTLASATTPSTEDGSAWGPPNRPLPETPLRGGGGRVPLADRSANGTSYHYNSNNNNNNNNIHTDTSGAEDTPSRKSWKTGTRSMKSAKSLRSVWADEEDDDVWEDMRPPTTFVDDWDDGIDSEGSFAVYI
ncbi:hypothetical protein GGR53DRAFT_468169 [Hypoxylon sp. FL1150]|nr:hypothetical protein GGR53DRAFT_468169 [Hypoxylon sp. FL1150]